MNGVLKTYENNSMSLSCEGVITIERGMIKCVTYKGYPRTGGRDTWLAFYKKKSKGDEINQGEIDNILSFNGRNNVVSVFESTQEDK